MVTPAIVNTLQIYKRADFVQQFNLTAPTPSTAAIDLTGYTAAFNVRSAKDDSLVVAATCTLTAPTTGVVTAYISDTLTAAIDVDIYNCELLLTVGDITDAFLKGKISVS